MCIMYIKKGRCLYVSRTYSLFLKYIPSTRSVLLISCCVALRWSCQNWFIQLKNLLPFSSSSGNTKKVIYCISYHIWTCIHYYCQTPLQLANPTQLQLVWVGDDFVFPRKKEGRKYPHLAFSRRNDPTCLIFGDCLVGVWRVYGNCLEDVWRMSVGCLECVLSVSWRCLVFW